MDLITLLGGPTQVANYCSKRVKKPLSIHAVGMWRTRGNIPLLYRTAVRELAREKGVAVPEDFIPWE